MKILAIRGCNLASLAGEFEIDLSRGPLGMAGVFAIVGPTGAGKSTLLDAMCVALFDRTPRLPGHSRVVVGHGEEDPLALGAQDPRTLLRRGASQGWAEVDFESGDARRYRARWSVRRARGATHGNLQDQQVSLVALDRDAVITERLGGTKMETLKAIHQRLGLTFDQFRRSALLAQGDFAAFLRADGKDRSELLERMTGTQIYSKLSIAAHVHAAAAEQQLRDRQAAVIAVPVLSAEARAEAEQGIGLANAAREAARARLAEATAFAAWRTEAAARGAALAQAESELAVAQAEARGAEALRGELVVRRRAEGLRSVWDEAARLDRQHSIVRGELAKALAAVAAARTAQEVIAETRGRVTELHGTIRKARIAAVVVEVEAAGPRERIDVEQVDPFMRSVEAAEEQGQAAMEPAAWLVERRTLAPEIAAWPELDAKLVQERVLADAIAVADRVLEEQRAQHVSLVAHERSVADARAVAEKKLQAATREADSFVKKRTLGLDAAGRAEDDARARCAEVDRLVSISNGARAAAQILAELHAHVTELEATAELDRVRRDAITGELTAASVLRDERARVVGELRKAAGYEHARAELVEGEPCPLCGAEDHPWKHKGAFDALIADADAALGEAATRVGEAQRMLAQLDAREVTREAERARFASTRMTAQQSAESFARDWREQMAALGELMLITDPAQPEAAKLAVERFDAAKAKLEAARATRASAEAAHKAIAEANARVKVCQVDLDHHTAELRSLAQTLADAASAVERTRGERDTKVERRAELARELIAIAARWAAALPAADRASLMVVPAQPRKKRATKVVSDVEAALGVDLAKRADDDDRLASQSEHAATDSPDSDEAQLSRRSLAGKRSSRSADVTVDSIVVFDDASAVALGDAARKQPKAVVVARAAFAAFVQAWHQRAGVVAQAEAVLARAASEIERATLAAERAIADATARDAETKKRSSAVAAELVAANAALDEARITAGFEREALQRVLAADPSRIDELVTELERLDRAVDRASTRIAERRRVVDDHRAARPTPEVLDVDRIAAARDANRIVASADGLDGGHGETSDVLAARRNAAQDANRIAASADGFDGSRETADGLDTDRIAAARGAKRTATATDGLGGDRETSEADRGAGSADRQPPALVAGAAESNRVAVTPEQNEQVSSPERIVTREAVRAAGRTARKSRARSGQATKELVADRLAALEEALERVGRPMTALELALARAEADDKAAALARASTSRREADVGADAANSGARGAATSIDVAAVGANTSSVDAVTADEDTARAVEAGARAQLPLADRLAALSAVLPRVETSSLAALAQRDPVAALQVALARAEADAEAQAALARVEAAGLRAAALAREDAEHRARASAGAAVVDLSVAIGVEPTSGHDARASANEMHDARPPTNDAEPRKLARAVAELPLADRLGALAAVLPPIDAPSSPEIDEVDPISALRGALARAEAHAEAKAALARVEAATARVESSRVRDEDEPAEAASVHDESDREDEPAKRVPARLDVAGRVESSHARDDEPASADQDPMSALEAALARLESHARVRVESSNASDRTAVDLSSAESDPARGHARAELGSSTAGESISLESSPALGSRGPRANRRRRSCCRGGAGARRSGRRSTHRDRGRRETCRRTRGATRRRAGRRQRCPKPPRCRALDVRVRRARRRGRPDLGRDHRLARRQAVPQLRPEPHPRSVTGRGELPPRGARTAVPTRARSAPRPRAPSDRPRFRRRGPVGPELVRRRELLGFAGAGARLVVDVGARRSRPHAADRRRLRHARSRHVGQRARRARRIAGDRPPGRRDLARAGAARSRARARARDTARRWP
ncbi:MAG: AAA family ATPase [Kofleriaceae bacterium]